jgi:predicted DNA binding CopG/RHH family protein
LQGTPAHIVLGVTQTQLQQLNEDQQNQMIHDRSQGSSLSEVWQELYQTHTKLMAELEAADFESLKKPDRIETLPERTILESVVYNTYEHYQEHLATMQREFSSEPDK